MFRSIKYSFRLIGIALTLARFDALFALGILGVPGIFIFPLYLVRIPRPGWSEGKRLVHALKAMGPTFIKLGQSLSTRSDLVGENIATELANLRDRLPPFPARLARATIREELGREVDDIFLAFDDKPVAAASIAQVHFATLENGQAVAVKILRPGIEQAFARDLELFFWVAEWIERRLPGWRRLKPLQVVKLLQQMVDVELDLRYEASAAEEFGRNLKNTPEFIVPRIHWEQTARRVLVMERIEGVPISDVGTLRTMGHNPDAILEKAAVSFFRQVFEHGFFHADLHPGNLFVAPDGRIAVVDFGIMGRLDRRNRIYIAEILRGFLNEDFHHVAAMHFAAGYVPDGKEVDQFAMACMAIAKPILGKPMSQISFARLLAQLFKVAEQFEMETQTQLLLLQKTMMVAEGVGRMLNPEVNMWQIAQPLVENWARENLGPLPRIRDGLEELWKDVQRLPHVLREAEAYLQRRSVDDTERQKERLAARRRHWRWLVFGWISLIIASGFAFAMMEVYW